MINKRIIAIHLPQYHPIPENDLWWGKGFTEWTNVTKAKPLFDGHYQPHLPSDLGFYDLRLEEARLEQETLAKQHGIFGFCYYHYWFNGKRVLNDPVDRKIKNPKEDLPFMLCWANENWTRRWDGQENHILLKQDYSVEDDTEHIKFLIPIFKDPRYIRVDNKPVVAIYRSSNLPDSQSTIKVWKEEALKEGIELYICRMESFGDIGIKGGYDAAIEFQPFTPYLDSFRKKNEIIGWDEPVQKLLLKFYRQINLKKEIEKIIWKRHNRLSYPKYIEWVIKNYDIPNSYKKYPCVFPSWDNTARRGNESFLFTNSTPASFSKLLQFFKNNFKPYSDDENFIFINAWNEWAEGNHLEPCQRFDKSYLEVVKKVLDQSDKK
jgi:lipopolysaccharide biosynthesis protein